MNTKKRDIVLQHWRRLIRYETRDLGSLQLNCARILADRDVRGDPALESLLQGEIENRRRELEQDARIEMAAAANANPPANEPSQQEESIPTVSPTDVRADFDRLTQALGTSLQLGDSAKSRDAFEQIRALHAKNPGAIPPAAFEDCKRRLGEFKERTQKLNDQIATLEQRVVSASESGKAEELAKALRLLSAIHTAHPQLLDEPELNRIRMAALRATDEHRQHQLTTRTLLDRERAIAAEIEKLAVSVRHYHRVACELSDTSETFQQAEAAYLQTIEEVRTYDREWFTGIVLELADLLAEWSAPPPGAERQIDRFLDGIKKGLASVREEMQNIENVQDSKNGDEG